MRTDITIDAENSGIRIIDREGTIAASGISEAGADALLFNLFDNKYDAYKRAHVVIQQLDMWTDNGISFLNDTYGNCLWYKYVNLTTLNMRYRQFELRNQLNNSLAISLVSAQNALGNLDKVYTSTPFGFYIPNEEYAAIDIIARTSDVYVIPKAILVATSMPYTLLTYIWFTKISSLLEADAAKINVTPKKRKLFI